MKKFEITKEQILQLNGYNNYDLGVALKKWFPQAFESELEVGKWYKYKGISCFLVCITNNGRYGFNTDGDWFSFIDSDNLYNENYYSATDKEVETALIAEAKRRGYENNKIYCIVGNIGTLSDKLIEGHFSYYNNALDYAMMNSAYTVFNNGKWAEICEEPIELTLEQQIENFIKDENFVDLCKKYFGGNTIKK